MAAIISEESTLRAINFDIIFKSHFDKLLEDLMNAPKPPGPTWKAFTDLVNEAEFLHHRWLQRFKQRYLQIDDERMRSLQEDGALHDLALTCDLREGGHSWLIDRTYPCQSSVRETTAENCYQPGRWWLNMASAHRDKIVSKSTERISKGQYGMTALPMLTGSEEDGEMPGTCRFTRKGRMADMHIGLMQQVGQVIRVLRGSKLLSKYAPKAGIRYDGLYILRRYGQTRDERTDICHLDITLERLGGQTPMQELSRIPLPSQLDDWYQYMRMLGEDIRSREGEVAFHQWNIAQETERKKNADWRKDREFKEVIKDSAQEIVCR